MSLGQIMATKLISSLNRVVLQVRLYQDVYNKYTISVGMNLEADLTINRNIYLHVIALLPIPNGRFYLYFT